MADSLINKPTINITLFPDNTKVEYSLDTSGFAKGEVAYSQAVNRAFRGAYLATTPLLNYIANNSLYSFSSGYNIDYTTSEDVAYEYITHLKDCPVNYANSVITTTQLPKASSGGDYYELAMVKDEYYLPNSNSVNLQYKSIYEGSKRLRYVFNENKASTDTFGVGTKSYNNYLYLVGQLNMTYDNTYFNYIRPIYSSGIGTPSYMSNTNCGFNIYCSSASNGISYTFYKPISKANSTLSSAGTQIELPNETGKLPVLDASGTIKITSTLQYFQGEYAKTGYFKNSSSTTFTRGSIFSLVYAQNNTFVFLVLNNTNNNMLATCLNAQPTYDISVLGQGNTYDLYLISGDTE